ncbi:LptF/LptG family permease [Sphingomonas sp.]|uniref:LptF/LptG family permease n=1 Tax=Sphingomonas sp. TaxID=28214 RepID=UPI003CC6A9F6
MSRAMDRLTRRVAIWRPGAIDRYLFRLVGLRMLSVIGVVVTIMTLENAPRLTADLEHADMPGRLLWRLSLDLVPEHLAIAIPVAVLVAVAFSVRTLAGRGEWQMLAAAGMSPARALAAPTLLAALAAGALLVNGLALRPLGERSLDGLYTELVTGSHGVAVPLREPVPLDADTTLMAEGAGPAPGELTGVLVRRGATVLTAGSAHIQSDGRGHVALLLGEGSSLETRADGSTQRLAFTGMMLHGQPPMLDLVPGNLRHRLDRLGGAGLWALAHDGAADATLRDGAAAALLARIEAALFCLLLPWLAAAVGVPPRRRAGGAAMLVGVVLIVLHLQTAAVVEDGFAAAALGATAAHAALWVAITAGLTRFVRARGDGAIDDAIARAVPAVRRLVAVLAPVATLRAMLGRLRPAMLTPATR